MSNSTIGYDSLNFSFLALDAAVLIADLAAFLIAGFTAAALILGPTGGIEGFNLMMGNPGPLEKELTRLETEA